MRRQSRESRSRFPIGGEPAPHPGEEFGFIGAGETRPTDDNRVGAILRDLYRAETITDPLGTRELRALRVPLPRREVNPAVAGDGQRDIDRPLKLQNRALLSADQAASSACERSARMSSSCSIPIDNRT
jgi:hypothetical protein